jgi:acetyl esterase/lipase
MAFPRQVPLIPRRSAHHLLETDVVYDEVDGEPLRYDLYRPLAAKAPVPAVVFVHGGGWANGDPSQAAGNGLHFARAGIATVSLSYRLAPRHRFPAQLDDVRRGLRYVRHNAEALGIDPTRLVLLGLSAGAHLVMLSHLARGVPELEPALPPELTDVSEHVLGVMAHYGPYDLTRRRPTADYDPIGQLLGERVDDPAWVRLASPVADATRATAPVLLIHGTADDVVSHHESERMHAALVAAGKRSELLILEGAPHAFQVEWKGDANQRANQAMDALLTRVFDATSPEVASRV